MHGIPVLRVAAIHDLSGFGRASLTVAIPILSTMGIQVCPLPTAVLSSQTSGVEDFTFHDLTPQMGPALDHWQRLGLRFDAVYSGFLGNPVQVELVERCIREFLGPEGFAVVDPVLGDNGSLDPTQTPEMVAAMRRLAGKADIITPNFTESAFLLDEPWRPEATQDELKDRLIRLAALGPSAVIITSAPAPSPDATATVAYDRIQARFWRVEGPRIPAFYPGTGDIFASVLTGSLLQGDSLPVAVDRAVGFVVQGMRVTCGHTLPERDGVLLERVLGSLRSPFTSGGCTEF
ncbi:MAG: pyridoxamine kinase [Desulfovibrionaceae bacterium]|nr:pyridoxamine kinase [Desulfovibrionaceae bacterium]